MLLFLVANFRTADSFSVKNAGNLVLFLLLLLIGWQVFGAPLHK